MMHVFLLAISLFFLSPLAASLPSETLIQTPIGYQKISSLEAGDLVCGFDLHAQKNVTTPVLSVLKYATKKQITITTPEASFTVSDDQLIRVKNTSVKREFHVASDPENLFVQAQNINVGDLVQTSFGRWLAVTKIECITQIPPDDTLHYPQGFIKKDKAFFYGLHLAEPHHFFATEQAIFMHNFAMAIPAGFAAADAFVAACGIGLAAAGAAAVASHSNSSAGSFGVSDASCASISSPAVAVSAPAVTTTDTATHAQTISSTALSRSSRGKAHHRGRSRGGGADFSGLNAYDALVNPTIMSAQALINLNPTAEWQFSGGLHHNGFLLFYATTTDPKTGQPVESPLFRGLRHDPLLQHIRQRCDDAELQVLAQHFSTCTYQEKLNFIWQISAYNSNTDTTQKQNEKYDRAYGQVVFKSTALFKCLQYNIAPHAVINTIVLEKKGKKYMSRAPLYQVYESRENNVKVLIYAPVEAPVFSTNQILAVAPFDGEVEVPTDELQAHAFFQKHQQESLIFAQKFKDALIEKSERIHQQHLENYVKNTQKNEPVECAVLHRRCTQDHVCSNCPVSAETIALNEQFKGFGFSDSWYTYRPSAAAFIAEHNLSQRDVIELRESHIARPFRQHTALTLGFVPERNIAFLFNWQKNTFITLFSCTKQQYESYFSSSQVECDFDPSIALLSEEQTPTKELSPAPESKPEDEPPPVQPPAVYSPPPTVIAPGTNLTTPEPRPPKPPAPLNKPGLVILGHTARGLGLACAGVLHQIVIRGLGQGISGLTISGLVEKADLAKNDLDTFDSDLSRRIHFCRWFCKT